MKQWELEADLAARLDASGLSCKYERLSSVSLCASWKAVAAAMMWREIILVMGMAREQFFRQWWRSQTRMHACNDQVLMVISHSSNQRLDTVWWQFLTWELVPRKTTMCCQKPLSTCIAAAARDDHWLPAHVRCAMSTWVSNRSADRLCASLVVS